MCHLQLLKFRNSIGIQKTFLMQFVMHITLTHYLEKMSNAVTAVVNGIGPFMMI